jgi:Domain of unknown function (DUF1737)
MIRYIIIEATTPQSLQEEVNVAISHGYFPVGGIAASPENKRVGLTYMQAMVIISGD